MKKIIFLVGYYFPKAMANGICVGALADEFIKKKYEVHVICLKNGDEMITQTMDGVKIHRINPSLYRRIEQSRNFSKKTISKWLLLLIKLVHIPFYPLTSFFQIKRYVTAASKLIEKERAVIVSCFNPIEAVAAGMNLKKRYPYITNIGYYLDSLSNEGKVGILPQTLREKAGITWERKLFAKSDGIFIMKSHEIYYKSSYFSKFMSKMRFVDIPLLRDYSGRICNSNTLKIVYTGMLSSERRNPEYACNLLSKVFPTYEIDFYGRGDCDEILEQFSVYNGGNVKNFGFVSHVESIKAIENAEILLSIGNNDSDMIPSKIFEYISTGKPIIHFAYDKRDACLSYLRKYSNGLIIYMFDDMEVNIKKCQLFYSRGVNNISKEELVKTYKKNQPLYTVDLMESFWKG